MPEGRNIPLSCALTCAALLGACYSSSEGRDVPDLNDPSVDDVPFDDVPELQPDPDAREDPDETGPDLPPDIVPPVTAEAYCLVISTGLCGFFTGCCTPEELVAIDASDLACEDPALSIFFELCMQDYGNAITGGTITVDRDAMDGIRADMDEQASACPGLIAATVSKAYAVRAFMGGALLGLLEAGQPCENEQECLEDLTCEPYTFVCDERVREGGVCREDTECNLGLVCLRGRCNAPADAGEPCADGEDCLVGLWCDVRDMCVPLLTVGDACDPWTLTCEGLCSSETYSCVGFCDGI